MVPIRAIARYIVKKVQDDSLMNGFQLIVSYEEIEDKFKTIITDGLVDLILYELGTFEEVADVQVDADGFDVVLYTAYAPNYNEEDYE